MYNPSSLFLVYKSFLAHRITYGDLFSSVWGLGFKYFYTNKYNPNESSDIMPLNKLFRLKKKISYMYSKKFNNHSKGIK